MNGLGIVTHSLADTGANGYLFLNRPLAFKLSNALYTPILPLPYSVSIYGFKGKTQSVVSYYI